MKCFFAFRPTPSDTLSLPSSFFFPFFFSHTLTLANIAREKEKATTRKERKCARRRLTKINHPSVKNIAAFIMRRETLKNKGLGKIAEKWLENRQAIARRRRINKNKDVKLFFFIEQTSCSFPFFSSKRQPRKNLWLVSAERCQGRSTAVGCECRSLWKKKKIPLFYFDDSF